MTDLNLYPIPSSHSQLVIKQPAQEDRNGQTYNIIR